MNTKYITPWEFSFVCMGHRIEERLKEGMTPNNIAKDLHVPRFYIDAYLKERKDGGQNENNRIPGKELNK